jgi:hypothetical protein
MTELNLLFDFANHQAAERAASTIEEQLGQLEIIDEVQAEPQRMRLTGLEIAAAVAVSATVVQSATNVVENLGKLVEATRSLMLKLRDLKNVYVEFGSQRVPIDQLDTAKLSELAKSARVS